MVTLVVSAALAAPAAHAGQWIQVSCVNPNGSAAPSEGWSSQSYEEGDGSSVSTRCGVGAPMSAELSTLAYEPVGAYEMLEYAPPAGSSLVGGSLDLALRADGDGPSASSTATVYSPGFVFPDDVVLFCANGQGPCQNGTDDYNGNFDLPADLGGDIYVQAGCGGASGGTCENGTDGYYSVAQVISADLLLQNSSVPTATGFTGTLLSPRTSGTADLIFTASDPGGPGVYSVTATVDGTPVFSGTPNTDSGSCVAVGSSSGALMFDQQQPCPATTSVTVPVATTGLKNGRHVLAVTVTDAAGNSATVLDQDISIENPISHSPRVRNRHEVHARFDLGWRFTHRETRLRDVTHVHLPKRGRVAIECLGRRCPKLALRRERTHRAGRLWHELERARFHRGQKLVITVSEPRHRAEPIELIFRDHRKPRVRLLSRTPRAR